MCFPSRTCNITGQWALPPGLHCLGSGADLAPCLSPPASGFQAPNSLKPFLKVRIERRCTVRHQEPESRLSRVGMHFFQSSLLPFSPPPPGHDMGLSALTYPSSHSPCFGGRAHHASWLLQLCQDNLPLPWGHLLALVMDRVPGSPVTTAHVYGSLSLSVFMFAWRVSSRPQHPIVGKDQSPSWVER